MSGESVRVEDLVFDVDVSGTDTGTAVLLLHGFPETKASWRSVTERLGAAGLRTIAPDQRGYSPGARPVAVDDYHIDRLVADALGLLDALAVTDAHVVGHDWGAIVAWFLAARYPERVRTLTAVSVPHPAAFGWALRVDADQQQRSSYITLLRQEGKAEDLLLVDGAQRLRAMFGGAVDARLVDEHVALLTEPGALTAALGWYRAMTADFAALAPVTVPTTYVWSTEDVALGRAGAERCGEYVTGPYRFVELSGVTHWIPEQAPAELTEAVLARIAESDRSE
ncbi:alpha/beta hydrolase [Rhodococcus sp. D2-41]|uniref:alpha/beta fold hydrolase n=1 Tax=Speluncibacter jeojiensis TaxID=2710754 RepID=UPI0024107BBA|nr:alpha/beta hydrolase [Rhodococcus sp. D2-41]MDG3009582.1 alpha/beta hydrolase [Rhodococcus sp. D2-41]